MLQLAFCDDDLSELQTIQTLLDRYRVARNQEIRYTAFQNAWDLLAEVERGTRYDVLLLDVLMPGQNGIEVAGELRQYDNNVKIIFLTSSPEFAVQSYAQTLREAALLNEKIKLAMEGMKALTNISSVKLNTDYDFTDEETKEYRYQAVYDLVYME